jgi:hypothetical protein
MNGTTAEQNFAQTFVAFFRRLFWCDFRTERATDWESRRLQRAGFQSPLAQAYVAWRWPLLAMAVPLLLFQGIWDLATFTWLTTEIKKSPEGEATLDLLGTGSFDLFDASRLMGIISIFIGAVMMGLATGFCMRFRLSRLLTQIGWIIMFVTPFLLAIFPQVSLMNFEKLQEKAAETARNAGVNPEQAAEAAEKAVQMARMLMGGIFAFAMLQALGPRILGLFPGMIRSSVTIKTLLPESSAAGWLTTISAPIWTLFLLLGLVVMNQMQESVKLALGLMFWILSTLVYVVWAKVIVRPCAASELGRAVIWPRRISTLLNLVGAILLVWSFFEVAGAGDVFSFILGALGNMLVLTVVASDFVLPLLRWSFHEGRQFHLSPLMPALEAKYEAFTPIPPAQVTVLADKAPPAAAQRSVVMLRKAEDPPAGGEGQERR